MPAPIVTADSITRIGDEANGAVVVNASHGGIYAAYLAAKLHATAAIFNAAGVGKDRAGIGGLDYLDALIGDARPTYEDGAISRVNARAAALGLHAGVSAGDFVDRLRKALA